MTNRKLKVRSVQTLLACAVSLALPLSAAPMLSDDNDSGSHPAASSAASSSGSEIEQLKRMLADQQRQIDELRKQLAGPSKVSEPSRVEPTPVQAAAPHTSLGEVASTTPMLPALPAVSTNVATPIFQPTATAEAPAPTSLKIGNTYITPVGFMDMTLVTRSTAPGSGIGTNFGSIPYDHTQAAALSETRLSPQNSRLGVRFDALVKDMKILGYWESDFLGQIGSPPNGGLAVSSNPYVFRMRLYWIDVLKGKFEFLAGQSWSLATPNRKGISPLPGDIFYSQDIDVNYQAGLVWGRLPGFRFGYHPNSKVALALALENSEPYIGGGNGGSGITLPSAFPAANATSGAILGGQINNGASVISAAALHPDIIAKVAFDPSSKFHFEVMGMEITNKIANPVSSPAFQTSTKAGGGGAVNLSFLAAKNLRILTNNFWGAGGGRYIFGQAPDFVIRSNGTLSLVHSASTVTGLEFTSGKTLYYAYYGGIYIAKNLALDANGTSKIGYGPIASDGQNRSIQEVTFGTNTTLMKDSKWGALNMMFQYSYLQRNPWLVATGAFSNAHVSMGFINFRYSLPGSAPTLK